MFELTIAAEFEAAHRLPNYPGKCQRLHGHNWRVDVAVKGNKLNELGMLIDFHDLKQEVNKVILTLDHFYLNETEAFQTITPTAENIAKYIYDELHKNIIFSQNLKISSVKVWESQHSAVLYSEGVG